MKLDEIAGAINYWVAADGKEYRIDEPHVVWAAKRAGIPLPTNRDLPEYMATQDQVYAFMFNRNWMRASIDFAVRYMYVERMANSRHKKWVADTCSRYHLRAEDTEGNTICDFRAKQEAVDPKEWMMSVMDVETALLARGYTHHTCGTADHVQHWYSKTMPSGASVEVYVGGEQERWDCALTISHGHVATNVIYPQHRSLLMDAVADAEKVADDPIVASAIQNNEAVLATLDLLIQSLREKYGSDLDEAALLAKRSLFTALGAQGFAHTLLEVDAREWMLDQPVFYFYPYANMLLVTVNDASRTIGMIKGKLTPTGEEDWQIQYGSHSRPKLPDAMFKQHFKTKIEAADALLKAFNQSQPPTEVKEASDLNDGLQDPVAVFEADSLCPICGSDEWKTLDGGPQRLTCDCQRCHSRWQEQFEEGRKLVGLDIQESPRLKEAVDPRDWMLANAGLIQYQMKAYETFDQAGAETGLRMRYDYEFKTLEAAYKAALHKVQNHYVEIEEWDIPSDTWPHGDADVTLLRLWIVTQDGELKEASPERKAQAGHEAKGEP